MNYKLAAISLILAVIGVSVNAQQPDMLPVLQKQLADYQASHPSSNLYLHLDKTIYTPEETVWFKAYLLGDTLRKAKVLYVRIVNEEKTIVAEAQFPIYDVRAHGSIELSKLGNTRWVRTGDVFNPPRILIEGKYTLYAYTDRMVALGDTNVFVQPIRISRMIGRRFEATASVTDTAMLYTGGQVQIKVDVTESGSFAAGTKGEYQLLVGSKELKYGRLTTNTFGEAFVNFTYPDLADHESLKVKLLFTKDNDYAELSLNLPHQGNPVTLNCFPEGGKPVPGGRVAIEALDILGNPVQTALQVMDGDSTVARVATDAQGTASVELPHAVGVRYTVETLDGRGQATFDVPTAGRLAGFSLKLHQDSMGSRAMIRNLGPDSSALLVLRTHREILWSTQQVILPGDSVMVVVPMDKYPKDVLSLAVFGRDGTPQAERLFLNRETEDYRIEITLEQQDQGYGTKQRMVVTLRTTNTAGLPVAANLSIGVTAKNRLDSTAFRNILQQHHYCTLAPRLRGMLFSADDSVSVNNLLLGMQWHRNQWDSIHAYSSEAPPSCIPGTDRTTGVVIPMQYNFRNHSSVPAKRKIKSVVLRSLERLDVGMKGVSPVFRMLTVEVDPVTNTFFVPDSLLLSRRGQEWEMWIPTTSKEFWDYHYLVEWQDPNIRFDSIVVRGMQVHMQEMANRIAVARDPVVSTVDFRGMNRLGEVVIGREKRPVQRTLRKTNCEEYEGRLYIEIEKAGTRREDILPLIKGQTGRWGYTPYGEPRTIIYLGCGRYRDINYIKNITIPGEFPLPDYEASPTTELDMRSTVYWNPNVYTDVNGTATFSFFTSDVTGEFEIVAQGLVESTLRPLMGTGNFNVTNR